ncbi:MAG: LemA family protein [Clostridia bacterium]|nr:LemA family protein [Clostridia bacterium]
MEPGMIVAMIVVIALLMIWVIAEHNTIKRLQNKVKQSRSGIDVALTKRFDLIPNLIECVKGYCAHEEKVLQELTKARTDYLSSKSLKDGEVVNNKTRDVLMLAEKYPNLKASSNFLELQSALERTENSLSAARRLYNGDVTIYNTKIQTFPGNIFAGFMGAKEEKVFEAEQAVRANTKVNF